MRYSRSAKYRKKYKKLVILTKVFIVWYSIIASITLLTSNTSAYFNSNNDTNILISAATSWWDGSELIFLEKGAENIKACAPIEISVEIKNVGLDMRKTSVFEVYYVDHGAPKNPHGDLVGVGVIPKLKNNEITELVFEVTENGQYMFKAFQLPDYEGNADLEIWSKKIHVNCNAAKDNDASGEVDETQNELNEQDEIVDDEVTNEETTETAEQEEQQNILEDVQENETNNKENGVEVENENNQDELGDEYKELSASTEEHRDEIEEDKGIEEGNE